MGLAEKVSPERWLSKSLPVDRGSYVASGLLLMALKYALEVLVVYTACGRFWSPWVFLSPLVTTRSEAVGHSGAALSVYVLSFLAFVSLPFLAIGLSMSIRRAADAGLRPWVGLGFAAPGLNYLTMLVLAILPSRVAPRESGPLLSFDDHGALRAASMGVLSASALGVAVVFVASTQLAAYGVTVFFVLPIAMGSIAGYLVNTPQLRTVRVTLATALATTLVTGGALLLFALEGLVCLVMALPLALVVVLLGALFGREIARIDQQGKNGRGPSAAGPTLACLVLLPTLASVEDATVSETVYEVRSSLEVDAPAAAVWKHVIAFPELPPAKEWYFRSGIAVPMRARIEGQGVGAVRYCEFSTGAFVEPVTAWEPGHRLAFDVRAQPPPMEEWSPYRHLHPPHLDASLRSVRGEFRLEALSAGRTRLSGSTWYTLRLGPELYFRIWSDAIIHRIHLRVLEHVARLAERE